MSKKVYQNNSKRKIKKRSGKIHTLINVICSRILTFFKNSILYIEGEKCMIFPKVQFVARGRSPRATKHRGKNEHSLQKYILMREYSVITCILITGCIITLQYYTTFH
jgi:cytochrome b subunit of formate dehydrogenase